MSLYKLLKTLRRVIKPVATYVGNSGDSNHKVVYLSHVQEGAALHNIPL